VAEMDRELADIIAFTLRKEAELVGPSGECKRDALRTFSPVMVFKHCKANAHLRKEAALHMAALRVAHALELTTVGGFESGAGRMAALRMVGLRMAGLLRFVASDPA